MHFHHRMNIAYSVKGQEAVDSNKMYPDRLMSLDICMPFLSFFVVLVEDHVTGAFPDTFWRRG